MSIRINQNFIILCRLYVKHSRKLDFPPGWSPIRFKPDFLLCSFHDAANQEVVFLPGGCGLFRHGDILSPKLFERIFRLALFAKELLRRFFKGTGMKSAPIRQWIKVESTVDYHVKSKMPLEQTANKMVGLFSVCNFKFSPPCATACWKSATGQMTFFLSSDFVPPRIRKQCRKKSAAVSGAESPACLSPHTMLLRTSVDGNAAMEFFYILTCTV